MCISYGMIKVIISVNIMTTGAICVCVCETRTFRIQSLSKFQIYNRGCLAAMLFLFHVLLLPETDFNICSYSLSSFTH